MVIKSQKKNKLKNKNIPKKQKFNKYHKGIVSPITYKKSSSSLYYGIFGLKTLKKGRLNIKQLNAAKQKIIKFIRKKEKLWIRGFTDIPVTQKPNEIRMGKGKGSVSHWVVRLPAGFVLFELSKMSPKKAFYLLLYASKKLPIPTIVIHNSKHLTI